jgi:hypothetical protein
VGLPECQHAGAADLLLWEYDTFITDELRRGVEQSDSKDLSRSPSLSRYTQ